MSYPMKVEDTHILTYSNNVAMVAQMLRNPLLNAVTTMPCSGEAKQVSDLFNQTEYSEAEPRGRRNPEAGITASRRWLVMPKKIEQGEYVDTEDKWASATDPTSYYVKTLTAAVTRGYYDRLLGIQKLPDGNYTVRADGGGILGHAREGKTPGVGLPLPTSQYVPHGSTGMTLDKLRMAVKTLKKAEFGIDAQMDPLFGLISPEQEDDLLGIAAASGVALNTFTIEQLKSGKPTTLMGVTWILSNRLPLDASGNRLCPIFSKSNIVAGEWQPIIGDMWQDTSAKKLPYCYVSAAVDAVRVEDKGVIVIECTEA